VNGLWHIVAPRIHLEFANWLSALISLFLLVGMIAWISYVAWSISYLKGRFTDVATKAEVKKMIEELKRELQGHA
jgi:hypothetical protein